METYSHFVVKKMRRAGIVGLFAVGLTFAGVAPANALTGTPVQEEPYITQAKSVARLEVPRKVKAKDDLGHDIEVIATDVCTGVLIDAQHIATVRQCVPSSLTPYADLAKNMGNKGYDQFWKNTDGKDISAVRVTFGQSALPSTSKKSNNQTTVTYNPEQVFWASSAVLDAGKTQLAVVKLDRPVPATVGVPAKLVNNGKNGYSVAEGNFYGWRQVAGVPELNYYHTPLNVNYLVNNKQEQVRNMTGQWNTFMQHPQSFDGKSTGSGANMGSIQWQDVRKGFGDMNLKVDTEDRGAPVLDDKGNLVAIHVNSGVLLDASQTSVAEFLGKRPAAGENAIVSPDNPDAAKIAMKALQKYLCSQPDDDGFQLIDGALLPVDGMTTPAGKYTDAKTDKDDAENHIQKSDYDFDKVNSTEKDRTIVNADGTSREQLRRVNLALCLDEANTEATSVGVTLSAAKKANDEMGERVTQLEKARDQAQKEATAYANLLTTMMNMRDKVSGYNTPTREKIYNENKDYGTLPDYMKEGITFTNELDGSKIPIANKLDSDVLSAEPNPGKAVVNWLTKTLIQLNATIAGYQDLKDNADSALKNAQDKLDSATANKAYADAMYVMAQQTAEQINNLVLAQEDDWANKVGTVQQNFMTNYDNWAAEMYACDTSIFNAKKDKRKKTEKLAEANTNLGEAEAAMNTAKAARDAIADQTSAAYIEADKAYQNAVKTYNSKLATRDSAQENLKAANDALSAGEQCKVDQKAKMPKVTDKDKKGAYKYVPKPNTSKLVEAANKMPSYLLTMQNLALSLRAVQDGMKDAKLVDPTIIDAIIAQISGYYNNATTTANQIVVDGIAVGQLTNQARKAYASAPDELKKALKLRMDNIEQQNTVAADASNSALQAKDGLKDLLDKASRSTSTEESQKYLNQAAAFVEQLELSKQGSDEARDAATKRYEEFTAILKGEDPENPGTKTNPSDPTAGMSPKEKQKWEKEQAAKKKAAEAAAKKAADEAKKAQAERDKKAKADEKRLAKALSKNTLRAEGSNRVLTAIAAWKLGKFPGDSIVLVDGNVAADGLSATPFAAGMHAPILLTTWKTGLEPSVMDQIKASGKKNLYLVGGQVPMTPYDEFELRDAGVNITRIAGPDRFNTAVAVNRATEPLIGAAPHKPLNLFIADGVGFPDALVAGAAAGRSGALMLLSKGNTLDPATYSYISELGQTRPLQITAIGGPAVRAVQNTPWPTTMSVNIKPVMGKDRYETAANLAASQPGTTAAVLANGENFPDALSGGALAADQNAAMILTRAKQLPEPSYQALRRHGSEKTIVVGGPGAVSPKVAELVNGAKLNNDASKVVEGSLAESAALEAQTKAAEERAKQEALDRVRGMIKDTDSLKTVMSQLGVSDLDALAKVLSGKTTPSTEKK